MTDQKPTGVFVRLPITDEQAHEMYKAYCAAYARSSLTTRGTATQAALLAIGTPVQDRELPRIGTIAWFEKDREPSLASYCPALFKIGDSVPVTSLPDAIGQIAARDAKIARLNEELSVYRARMSELIAKEVAALKGGAA